MLIWQILKIYTLFLESCQRRLSRPLTVWGFGHDDASVVAHRIADLQLALNTKMAAEQSIYLAWTMQIRA